MTDFPNPQIQMWHIDRFVFYARNPRKNDAVVDRMCASIREFGFKIPVLARSDGTVVDGHLRLKGARKVESWPGGDINGIPTLLCDEWSDAQVKAFRLLVNRSVAWASWDEELLSLELQELSATDFDLALTGFDPREQEDLLTSTGTDEEADVAPPLPEHPVSRPGDLWVCGNRRNQHRVLCGDATSPEAVAHLLGDRKPFLMITDPPYGISLDSEWRARAGLNGCGPAEARRRRLFPETLAPIGPKLLNSHLSFRSLTCGMPPCLRAKFWTVFCGLDSSIINRSFGTSSAPF